MQTTRIRKIRHACNGLQHPKPRNRTAFKQAIQRIATNTIDLAHKWTSREFTVGHLALTFALRDGLVAELEVKTFRRSVAQGGMAADGTAHRIGDLSKFDVEVAKRETEDVGK